MNTRGLYLASTPMIALEAAGVALAQGGRAQLVLIEDFDLAARLAELLRLWSDCPFEAIHRVPGRYTEYQRDAGDNRHGIGDFAHRIRIKRALRRESLATLKRVDAEFRPDSVWVGNDRKVETQYSLHLASLRLKVRPGRYLDDGLYTYLGDVRVRSTFRLKMDWVVKRLTYGACWHTVSQAGTSPWIAEAWLAFPGQAVDQHPGRRRNSLPSAWFTGRPFLRLSALAAREFSVERAALRRCASILVLPHSNHLRSNPNMRQGLAEFVRAAAGRGERVAVKYHPREVDADPADLLGSKNVEALPTLLPMELLLPLLPRRALLCGEGSTALLAARWLRPDLRVFDLGISRDGYAVRARAFFLQHGITSIAGDLGALDTAT